VVRSIRTLGFDPKDIRILLISQAHFDHVDPDGYRTLTAAKKAAFERLVGEEAEAR